MSKLLRWKLLSQLETGDVVVINRIRVNFKCLDFARREGVNELAGQHTLHYLVTPSSLKYNGINFRRDYWVAVNTRGQTTEIPAGDCVMPVRMRRQQGQCVIDYEDLDGYWVLEEALKIEVPWQSGVY